MSTKDFCKAVMKQFVAIGVQAGQLVLSKGSKKGEYVICNTFYGRSIYIWYDHTEDTYRFGKTSLFSATVPATQRNVEFWSDDTENAARRIYRELSGHYA